MARSAHMFVNYNPGLGRHPGRWRVVDDPHQFYDIDVHLQIAQIAERARFDAVFLSDFPAMVPSPPIGPWHAFDPAIALAATAVHTDRIGLIATASTTFNQPYDLSRRLLSLDHASHGRAGWNIVTTWYEQAAANFGTTLVDAEQRYERAGEFLEITLRLWDTFEDGALVADQVTGKFLDIDRFHATDYTGEFFEVHGALQVPRSPQGRPVLVQAGDSPAGRAFASAYADVVFGLQGSADAARAARKRLHKEVAAAGRDPEHVRFIQGIYPVVGSTEAEALEHRKTLDQYIDLEVQLQIFASDLEIDLENADLDRAVRHTTLPTDASRTQSKGLTRNFVEYLQTNPELTWREVILRQGGGARPLVGTPEQIADDLEHWLTTGAADGFNVALTHFPVGLERFAEHVIPELQRRGLFRTEYEGTTLREHLNLPVPPNVHLQGAEPGAAGS